MPLRQPLLAHHALCAFPVNLTASSSASVLLTRPPLASMIATLRSSRRLVLAEAIVTTQQRSSVSSIVHGSPAASVVHFLRARSADLLPFCIRIRSSALVLSGPPGCRLFPFLVV